MENMSKRMIEDRLEREAVDPRGYSIESLDEYYDRTVLGGNVTVRTRKEKYENIETSSADVRKGQPVFTGVLKYFPNALKEVASCSLAGNKQHHPDKELHWDKTKSTDNEDALVRHLIDHSINPMDNDGVLHLAKVCWRSLAALEIYLTDKNK